MQKISSTKLQELLKTSADTLRKLDHENNELKAKLSAIEGEERLDKIASAMVEKGMAADPATARAAITDMVKEGTALDLIDQSIKMRPRISPFGTVSLEKEASAGEGDALTGFLLNH